MIEVTEYMREERRKVESFDVCFLSKVAAGKSVRWCQRYLLRFLCEVPRLKILGYHTTLNNLKLELKSYKDVFHEHLYSSEQFRLHKYVSTFGSFKECLRKLVYFRYAYVVTVFEGKLCRLNM